MPKNPVGKDRRRRFSVHERKVPFKTLFLAGVWVTRDLLLEKLCFILLLNKKLSLFPPTEILPGNKSRMHTLSGTRI